MSAARRLATFGILGILLIGWAVYQYRADALSLSNPYEMSGYILLVLMLALAFFNARKKLSMLPLGRAVYWLAFHAVGGVTAVILFWVHTRVFWPTGLYEQIITALFYIVSLSGLVGYGLQRLYPARLADSGLEVIYERIPEEIAEIRGTAEDLIRECAEKTGSDTIPRYYIETLGWFFERPRYLVNHLAGGLKARAWLDGHFGALRRYADTTENEYLDQLEALANRKVAIDLHYAAQSLMKRWLLVHVPFSASLLIFAIWHFLTVNVYVL